MNKEQVLSALKSCGFNKANCDRCPYYNEKNCIHKLMQDAYSFLNEPQEPKKIYTRIKPEAYIITLEDIQNKDFDYMYLQAKDIPNVICVIKNKTYKNYNNSCVFNIFPPFSYNDYCKTWFCWTERPTEEQARLADREFFQCVKIHKEPEFESFRLAYCPLCSKLIGQEITDNLFICPKCNAVFKV